MEHFGDAPLVGRAKPPGCQCCKHASCIPLKEHCWCRDWLFLRWEASRIIWPSEMLNELRAKLGNHEFRFYANRKLDGKITAFEILLRLNSPKRGGLIPSSLMESNVFNNRETRVWRLQCCWDAVKWDTKAWIDTLRRPGDSLVLGDAELLDDLEERVRGLVEKAPDVVA